MQIVRYETTGRFGWGFLEDGVVYSSGDEGFVETLAAGHHGLTQAYERVLSDGEQLDVGDLRLLAPVSAPSKVICMGLNYRDHANESGFEAPKTPLTFAKYPSAIIGPMEGIKLPRTAEFIDWEVELAVIIGRAGRDIPEGRALEHVAGYSILNDISARDVQQAEGQWTRAKSFDTFCPIGPAIVTTDSLGSAADLAICLSVNGVEKQAARTSDLIFSVPEILAFISASVTLNAGDVIATGTPSGIGFSRKPPEMLRRGDLVRCEIDGIGVLENPVS